MALACTPSPSLGCVQIDTDGKSVRCPTCQREREYLEGRYLPKTQSQEVTCGHCLTNFIVERVYRG